MPDAYLSNWLLDTGSLTERLQSQCRQFTLHLLGQRQLAPTLEEINQLGALVSKGPGDWQIREVILCGDNQPWVFARSILPDSLCEADLSGLGNKPLGQIIFNDSRFVRSPFQLTCIKQNQGFLDTLGIEVPSDMSLWGRRSSFRYQHHQMMVSEIFLPKAPAYSQMSGRL